MFWIVDNFLMRRKLHKGIALKAEDAVKFVARPHDVNLSDDEVVLHSLMDNEACDTFINDDHDVIHRRDNSQ